MGRKKIVVKRIEDDRIRAVTFRKRKDGLFKKAMELSLLCGAKIHLVVFSETDTLHEYSTTDPKKILEKYFNSGDKEHEVKCNRDYETAPRVREGSYLQEELEKEPEMEEEEGEEEKGEEEEEEEVQETCDNSSQMDLEEEAQPAPVERQSSAELCGNDFGLCFPPTPRLNSRFDSFESASPSYNPAPFTPFPEQDGNVIPSSFPSTAASSGRHDFEDEEVENGRVRGREEDETLVEPPKKKRRSSLMMKVEDEDMGGSLLQIDVPDAPTRNRSIIKKTISSSSNEEEEEEEGHVKGAIMKKFCSMETNDKKMTAEAESSKSPCGEVVVDWQNTPQWQENNFGSDFFRFDRMSPMTPLPSCRSFSFEFEGDGDYNQHQLRKRFAEEAFCVSPRPG